MANSSFALVTGGNGWLGKRLVAALVTEGARVRCLVPSEEPAEELAKLGVELVRGDVRSAEARRPFLADAEGATLYHLAGIIHPPGRAALFDAVNYEAAMALIGEAAGLRRAVVMSSNSPIGCNPDPNHVFDENSPYNPYMGYGRSKMKLELALRERIARKEGPEIVIIRAPWFYGPGQPPRQTLFFRMIRNGKMPIFGDGLNKRSMAYTDSLASGLMLAGKSPAAAGEIFWVADARPYPMNEIIGTVADVLEKDFNLSVKGPARHLPGVISDVARLVDASLQSVGLYHQKIHVLSEMNQTIACGIAKAERVLGYKPLVELREGMRRSIEWCLKNGHEI
jgi:nucleoside-diphosphate-sugar epimerase